MWNISSTASFEAVAFLFDLSSLGFSGMEFNVLIASPPPADRDVAERWQTDFLMEQSMPSIRWVLFLSLPFQRRPSRNSFVGTLQGNRLFYVAMIWRKFFLPIPKAAFARAIIRPSATPVAQRPFNTNREASGALFGSWRNGWEEHLSR